jgi:preprotein translocase subunit SecF
VPLELIPHGTNYDFIGKWKYCVAGSLLIIALGLIGIPLRGIHWGLDFAGGTEMQIHFAQGIESSEGPIRGAVKSAGVAEPSVVRYGAVQKSEQEYLIRFSGAQNQGQEEKQGQIVDHIKAALTEKIGPVVVDRVEYVGPKVGADLRRSAIKALAISWILILAYVGFRFNPRFAPGGVIALIHDVLVTSSIWILLGQPFDLQVLAALLAIIGYSINDTIIIYDRIRETMAVHTSHDLEDVINKSVNATLSRTILTSGLTMLTVIALVVLAGPVVFPFSATMGIGIIVGTYSSIYIAAPIMLVLERRYGDSARAAAGAAGKGARAGGKAGGKGGGKRGGKGARTARVG